MTREPEPLKEAVRKTRIELAEQAGDQTGIG
jgi:hypothetical protein